MLGVSLYNIFIEYVNKDLIMSNTNKDLTLIEKITLLYKAGDRMTIAIVAKHGSINAAAVAHRKTFKGI